MKIKPMDYNRRDLFKLFGGSALLLHPLLSSREGYAQSGIKKRFVIMHTANGVIQSNFWPNGNAGSYNFSNKALAPLADYIKDLNIIKGLTVLRGGNNDAHVGGMVSLLTGNVVNDKAKNGRDFYTGDYIALGASIDQLYAASIKDKLSMGSLNLSVIPTNDRWTKYFTFTAQGKKIPREGDPYAVYKSIFAEIINCGGNGSFPSTPEMKLKRQSILDSILEDLKSATAHAGLTGDEKNKLDEYMTGIRDIEMRLAKAVTTDGEVCETLASFAKPEKYELTSKYFVEIAHLNQDLALAALQMDVTRVASIGYAVAGIPGWSVKYLKYKDKPITETHHQLTHAIGTDWDKKCMVVDTFHASQFARLLGKMKAIEEGGSNMLNNSLALWASELGDGQNHHSFNTPFVLAGKAGGAVKTGRYLSTGTEANPTSHQGLLLDILDALGVKHNNKIGNSVTNPKRVL